MEYLLIRFNIYDELILHIVRGMLEEGGMGGQRMKGKSARLQSIQHNIRHNATL